MAENEVTARLRALASDDNRRSETARLRDVFDDVEMTLSKGVSQFDVLAELHKLGFTMTMASFKSALQRIRKERTKKAQTTKTAAPQIKQQTSTSNVYKPAKPGDESNLI